TADLQQLQQALEVARSHVVGANRLLAAAKGREQQLRGMSARLHARIDEAALLSDRLAAQRRAVQFDVHLDTAPTAVEAAQADLEQAQSGLRDAQQKAEAPAFPPAVGSQLDAPTPLELPGDPPAPARVFTVVPETGDAVVAFARTGG